MSTAQACSSHQPLHPKHQPLSDQPYDIDTVSLVNPYTDELTDVYVIRDLTDKETVRCFDKGIAALVCALLITSTRSTSDKRQPLQCPACSAYESDVVDSRKTEDGVLRRRVCKACNSRYKTLERVVSLTTPGEDP